MRRNMFKLTLSKQLVRNMYFGRSVSSLSVRGDICNILNSHLKIDENGMAKLSKLKEDSIIATIPKKQLIQNCTTIQKMSVNLKNIQYLAHCLMLQPMIIRNRIIVLKEMGVKSIGLENIYRFPMAMRRSIKTFKKLHNIPQEQNVMETIFSNFGITVKDADCTMINSEDLKKAGSYYQRCVLHYKITYMKLHGTLCERNMKLKYCSITEISKLVTLLKTECHFNIDFIRMHPQLLNLDVHNVEEFLAEFKHVELNGTKLIHLLKKNPNMLFYEVSEVRELLRLHKVLGIPDQGLSNCLRILGMNKLVFLERYIQIANSYELALWLHHPRMVTMIYKYNSVTNRIRYLRPLNCINYANIQTYLYTTKLFMRFVEGDMEHTALRKYLKYVLHKELGERNVSLMYSIQKHPYWKHVPLLHIEAMLRYLKSHFSVEDICQNIHIVLYPRSKVIQVLKSVKEEYSPNAGYCFTDKQYLALCLYTLEKRYHFSGDAVWQSVHTEVSDLNPDPFQNIGENKSDELVEYINAHDDTIINVSGAAWLEYLLR